MRSKCEMRMERLASDPCPDGHERSKRPSALEHRLPYIVHQLFPSQAVPESPEAAEECAGREAHAEADLEPHLDPVPTRGALEPASHRHRHRSLLLRSLKKRKGRRGGTWLGKTEGWKCHLSQELHIS